MNVKALARVIIEPPFQDIINGERRGGLDAASVRNAIYYDVASALGRRGRGNQLVMPEHMKAAVRAAWPGDKTVVTPHQVIEAQEEEEAPSGEEMDLLVVTILGEKYVRVSHPSGIPLPSSDVSKLLTLTPPGYGPYLALVRSSNFNVLASEP